MGTIYCDAEKVMAWLGHGLDELNELFDFLRGFHHECATWLDRYTDMDAALEHQPEIEATWKELYISYGGTVAHWDYLWKTLLDSDNFRRAWVMQELHLAGRCDVVTSFRLMPTEGLALWDTTVHHLIETNPVWAEGQFRSHDFRSLRDTLLFWVFMNIKRSKTNYMYPADYFAMAVIFNNRRFECTNSRDRIYSNLSMMSHGHAFTVDYAESTLVLFVRTRLFCWTGQALQLN